MDSQNQLNKTEVLIRKKKEEYFLYAPAYNCIVSHKDVETAYGILNEQIENIERQKKEVGINQSLPFHQTGSNSIKKRVEEFGFFLCKSLLLMVIFLVIFKFGFNESLSIFLEEEASQPLLPSIVSLKKIQDSPQLHC